MFENLRKPGRAKGILASLIFGAICLTFIFTGMTTSEMGGGTGGAAAVINHQVITIADYRETLGRMEERFREYINAMPAAQRQMINQNLRNQALEELVNREVIYQAARDTGILVPDIEVAETIRGIDAFKENGQFQRSRYQSYLEGSRMSPGDFENKVRKDLALNRARNVFFRALEPLPLEVKKDSEAQKTRVNVEFVKFNRDMFRGKAAPSKAEVDKFLAHPENAELLNQYYESHKMDYTTPEEVRARHILVRFDGTGPEAEKKAETKIVGLQKRAETEDFAQLAKDNSDDPGSKEKGGDLGFFSRGKMVPEFEQAAFGTAAGKMVGPVKTSFGYHLIKVEDRRPGGTDPLEKVKGQVAEKMLSERRYDDAMAKIRKSLSDGAWASVEAEMKSMGAKWEETGRVELGQAFLPQLGESEVIMEKVLALGEPKKMASELVSHSGSDFLLRLKEVVVEEKKPDPTKKGQAVENEEEALAARRAGDAFTGWATEEKKVARIKRNAQLLAR